ncbi:hypothetical protein AAFF_G00035480 [Aldrovandia affinis]|uniref:SRCR domain-containing protein n=1 Tax=Aldrovandia affinis TaxID=143900 RepID=A0AAD7S3K3_9TELE|nr:hypothetical protein AAFF_G00035480 [Aldrovandia affinis]
MWILLLFLHIWAIHGENKLRLKDGERPCAGRVEVFHENVWGIVCNDKWQKTNEEVVCRSLSCGAPRGSIMGFITPDVTNTAWMNEVNCTGNERHLWDCTFPGFGVNSCPMNHHINIECSGAREANIVCREQNCGESKRLPRPGKFRAQGPALISSLNCTGDESYLWHCAKEFGTGIECSDPVGVICSDYIDLRLNGGTNRCSGTLEANVNDAWKPVCETNYRMASAGELCSRLRCGTNGTLEPETCNGTEHVNLTCSDSVQILLLDQGKESRCFGAVYVDTNGARQAVCADLWGEEEGRVVCREQGESCGPLIAAFRSETSLAKGLINQVDCLGSESSLWQCLARSDKISSCDEAYVVCEGSVALRLTDGLGKCSGRVEILYQGTWRSVSTEAWTERNVDEVCERVKCGKAFRFGIDLFSHGQGMMLGCPRPFAFLNECLRSLPLQRMTPATKRSMKVICTGHKTLRLQGDSPCSGRVGIETTNETYWLTWPNESRRNDTATVVCRQMHCGSALSFETVADNSGNSKLWKSIYNCSSVEKSLFDCPEMNRNGSGIASVKCSGTISVSLEKQCWGKVNVCIGGSCGGVCADIWTQEQSDMVCKDLDCGKALPLGQVKKTPRVHVSSVRCAQPANNLTQCNFVLNSDESYCQENPVYVVCSASVQAKLWDPRDRKTKSCDLGRLQCSDSVRMLLVDGSGCNGRVFVIGKRGKDIAVSKEGWGDPESRVLCRHLQCGGFVRHLGENSPFLNWWDEKYSCQGNETSIWDCVRKPLSISRDNKYQQLHIQCTGAPVLKLSGKHRCSGQVEINMDGKFAVCGQHWGDEESRVVCQELDCSQAISHDIVSNQGNRTKYVSCNGKEYKLWQCGTNDDTCYTGLVSVACADSVQLRLSETCRGEVQIHYRGEWETVCPLRSPTSKEAQLICAHLECGKAIDGPTQETKPQNMNTSLVCAASANDIRYCVGKTSCTSATPALVYCEKQLVMPKATNSASMIVAIVLSSILVLAAALVIWLRIRKDIRCSKTGMCDFDSGDFEDVQIAENEMPSPTIKRQGHNISADGIELTTRILPKVPRSAVEEANELDSETSSDNEYDDIAEQATDAAQWSEEEAGAPEQDQTPSNTAHGAAVDGEMADTQEYYDDVMDRPDYQNAADKGQETNENEDHPTQHGIPAGE